MAHICTNRQKYSKTWKNKPKNTKYEIQCTKKHKSTKKLNYCKTCLQKVYKLSKCMHTQCQKTQKHQPNRIKCKYTNMTQILQEKV